MAYQPLYATIEDTNAVRHTTSLRSRVEWIDFNLNTHFGRAIRVNSSSEGELTSKIQDRIYLCNSKIKDFEEKNNIKKVNEWKEKLKKAEEELKEKRKTRTGYYKYYV